MLLTLVAAEKDIAVGNCIGIKKFKRGFYHIKISFSYVSLTFTCLLAKGLIYFDE